MILNNIDHKSKQLSFDHKIVKFFQLKKLKLDIVGLMCLPPNKKRPDMYFKKMSELRDILGVEDLSMGMSGDYLEAIKYGSTFVRIGSKIFGQRY